MNPHDHSAGIIKIGNHPTQELINSYGGTVSVNEIASGVYLINSVDHPSKMIDSLRKILDKMTPEEIEETRKKYFTDDSIYGWNEITKDNLPMFYAKENGGSEHIVMDSTGEIGNTIITDHIIWYYEVAIPYNIKYWWNPYGEKSEINKNLNEQYMENTCGILLSNENGEMLIGHITNATKGRGGWSIPKGLADGNEDFKTAAVRELFEETGIVISTDALTEVASVDYQNKPKRLICFTATINTNDIGPLHCDSMFTDKKTGGEKPEIDGFKWLHPIDAAQIIHDTQVEALSNLFVHRNTLRIFDFDGTLIDTLDKERGSIKWKEITGNDWPYNGWWSKPESLDLKLCFEPTEVGKMLMEEDLELPKTLTCNSIVVTNRLMSLKSKVCEVLDHFNLRPKIQHVVTDMDKLTKPERVHRLVQLLKPLEIEVWEDREDHIQEYLNHKFECGDRTVPVKIHIVVDCKIKTTIKL